MTCSALSSQNKKTGSTPIFPKPISILATTTITSSSLISPSKMLHSGNSLPLLPPVKYIHDTPHDISHPTTNFKASTSPETPINSISSVENRPPAIAVEMRGPEEVSPVQPPSPTPSSELRQFTKDTFAWDYNKPYPTILNDNGIFTMKDLSTLDTFNFFSGRVNISVIGGILKFYYNGVSTTVNRSLILLEIFMSDLTKTNILIVITIYCSQYSPPSTKPSFRHPTARPHLHHQIYCNLHRNLRSLIHTRTQILLLTSTTCHPPHLTISVHFSTVAYSTNISSRPLTTLSSLITMCHNRPVLPRPTAPNDHTIPPTPLRLTTTPTIHPSQKQFYIVIPPTRTMITRTRLTSTILIRVPHAARRRIALRTYFPPHHTPSTMTMTTKPPPTTTMHLIGT